MLKESKRKILLISAAVIAAAFVYVGTLLIVYSFDLPDVEALENYEPSIVTVVYSDAGEPIAKYSRENRITLPLDGIPDTIRDAFVAAEDDSFFEHAGINPVTILRAAVRNLQAGRKVQGGSTITQQVAKTFFLSPERSFRRKIKEMFLAFELESSFSKEKILNLYVNQIFLGQGSYGVEAAAKTYFGKSTSELNYAEAAMLAGLPRAPSRDNPVANPENAKQKQLYVLRRLKEVGKITQEDFEELSVMPLQIKSRRFQVDIETPYFAEHVRRYLINNYGADALYEGGLRVHTTMQLEKQLAAQKALNDGLKVVDKRIGLRSPEKSFADITAREEFLEKEHLELVETIYDYKILEADGSISLPVTEEAQTPLEENKIYLAVVIGKNSKNRAIKVQVGKRKGEILPEDYKWAAMANPEEVYERPIIRNPYRDLKEGDVIDVAVKKMSQKSTSFVLEQNPLVQGSLLSYDTETGATLAMVGGYDFYVTKSEFNRATQAKRQSGSTFKPIVYAAALEEGLTPATVIVDSPIVYNSATEQDEFERTWKPHNYGARFYGDTRLRDALAFSRNVPTVKLLQHLGVKKVLEFSKRLGIKEPLNEDLSLALGSSALSLEELMEPWGVFANKGQDLDTHFIKRIEDRNGMVLEEFGVTQRTGLVEAPKEDEEGEEKSDPQILSPQLSFLITSLLQSVVDYGTGAAVKALGIPVAGKTGTTNAYKDALFIGYTPKVLSGVWIGFDADRPIGRNETGGRSAAPIWLDYMKVATKDQEKQSFDVPEGIIQVAIDAETGDIPTAKTKKRLTEFFIDGSAPGQYPRVDTDPVSQLAVNKTRVITGNTLRSRPDSEEGAQVESFDDETPEELLRDEY